jgi:hypothetical protein
MSYVDELLATYRRFVALPWQEDLGPAQRIWIAVYPPEHERRIRLHVPDFGVATVEARHSWGLIDISAKFETWLAGHEYRELYFESPELLTTSLPAFLDFLVADVTQQLEQLADRNGVAALIGAGTLFGLGDKVKVSALLSEVNRVVAGRLLVFFPGTFESNRYRLLDGRDGWDYLATPISPNGSGK